MNYRWIGAALVMAGCGGWGYAMVLEYQKQLKNLKCLLIALKTMQWELEYRLTPLPELCCMAGKKAGGPIGRILCSAAKQMEQQLQPDASRCISIAMAEERAVPERTGRLLHSLGDCLGRYDLSGQLDGLQEVTRGCQEEISHLNDGRELRLRSYRTLGLCAGAALVILFI